MTGLERGVEGVGNAEGLMYVEGSRGLPPLLFVSLFGCSCKTALIWYESESFSSWKR